MLSEVCYFYSAVTCFASGDVKKVAAIGIKFGDEVGGLSIIFEFAEGLCAAVISDVKFF